MTTELINTQPKAPIHKIKDFLERNEQSDRIHALLGTKKPEEVRKFVAGIMATVAADPKLQACEPSSIFMAAVDAINLGLPVDSRKLVYLIPYGKQVQLHIGWRGFIHKIKRENETIDIHVGIVFQGDSFDYGEEDGNVRYRHVVADANKFGYDYTKAIGAFCVIYYEVNGQQRGVIERISKAELDKMKAQSKSGIWNQWAGEMIKKAIIKRACKVHFAGAIMDLIEKDDSASYDLETARKPKSFDLGEPVDITPPPAQIEQGAMVIPGSPGSIISWEDWIKNFTKCLHESIDGKSIIEIWDASEPILEALHLHSRESYDELELLKSDLLSAFAVVTHPVNPNEVYS